MALTKSKGNMYSWVTHTHTHLGGACSHACIYCYVQAMAQRFPAMKAKYSGPVRLIEKELDVDYGSGKTIFIDHLNDLFAEDVSVADIHWVLGHTYDYPDNTYVFQTKNPENVLPFLDCLPPHCMIGTTIETNRIYPDISTAPTPEDRYNAMRKLPKSIKTFVTIEPILNFDLEVLAGWMKLLRPSFVNIGADSKNHGLPEPTMEKVGELIVSLQQSGIEIREKSNLERLRR